MITNAITLQEFPMQLDWKNSTLNFWPDLTWHSVYSNFKNVNMYKSIIQSQLVKFVWTDEDFVDVAHTLEFYRRELLNASAIGLKFFFHAGETG